MMHQILRSAAAIGLLMLGGTVAFAQNELTADVPFTFHTANAEMPQGLYRIQALNHATAQQFRVTHVKTGKTVVVLAADHVQRAPGDISKANVAFQCVSEYCRLSEINRAGHQYGNVLFVRSIPTPRNAQLATVRIPAIR